MAILQLIAFHKVLGLLIVTCCTAEAKATSKATFSDVCGVDHDLACEQALSVENRQDEFGGVSLLQHSANISRSWRVQEVGKANYGTSGKNKTTNAVNETHKQQNPQQNMSCIKNTGGSCQFLSCDKWRGPTNCSPLGRCMCATGYCASPNGKCVAQENKMIAHRFRLISAGYPNYSMAVTAVGGLQSIFNQLFSNYGVYISKTVTNDSYFDLYAFPGEGKKPAKFMLASAALENQVVNVFKTQVAAQRGGDFEVGLDPAQGGLFDTPATVQSLTMKLLKAPTTVCGERKGKKVTLPTGGRQAVVVRSFEYPRAYLSASWWTSAVTTVTGQWGDSWYTNGVGTDAIWYPDPPLPFKLKKSPFACESSAAVRSFWLSIITVLLSLRA